MQTGLRVGGVVTIHRCSADAWRASPTRVHVAREQKGVTLCIPLICITAAPPPRGGVDTGQRVRCSSPSADVQQSGRAPREVRRARELVASTGDEERFCAERGATIPPAVMTARCPKERRTDLSSFSRAPRDVAVAGARDTPHHVHSSYHPQKPCGHTIRNPPSSVEVQSDLWMSLPVLVLYTCSRPRSMFRDIDI